MKKIQPGDVYPIHLKFGQKVYFYSEVEEINFPIKFKISSKSAVTQTFVSYYHRKPWKDTSNIISRNKEIIIEYPKEIKERKLKKYEHEKYIRMKRIELKKKEHEESLIPKEELERFIDEEEKEVQIELEKEKDAPEEEDEEIKFIYFTLKAHNIFDANLRIYFYKLKTKGDMKKKGIMLLEKNVEKIKNKFSRVNYGNFKQFCKYGLQGLDTPKMKYGIKKKIKI